MQVNEPHFANGWHYSATTMPHTRLSTTEAVARNLKRLMELKGLTQKDVAKKSGVSQRTVSNMLNSTNEPGVEKVNAVAKVFGLAGWQLQMPHLPDDLLQGEAVSKVIDAMLEATPAGREMITRLAEREAHFSKQNPEK